MVKKRFQWIDKLSIISGVPKTTCNTIVKDLTLRPENRSFTSLCITPLVSLDSRDDTLAVAPQFPLTSAVDEERNPPGARSYLG